MSLQKFALLSLLTLGILAGVRAETTQSLYGQCGGINYMGPTKCPKTATCYNDGTNPWYSQCVETPWDNGGQPSSTSVTTTHTSKTTTSKTSTTKKTTTTTKTTTITKATTTTVTTPSVTTVITTLPPWTTTDAGDRTTTVTLTPDEPYTDDRADQDLASFTSLPNDAEFPEFKRQSGPGTTLQAGWYWIRAVVQPNYHKYLQTNPPNAPGTAILESYRTAGQYKVEDGQLLANIGTSGAPLYLHVEKPADLTQRTLGTWFNTTKNDFGAFAWQGDALTWSTPEVKRQNVAAWFVCASQALFINTGAYGYQTPGGCADQTIHYYNDAHANE